MTTPTSSHSHTAWPQGAPQQQTSASNPPKRVAINGLGRIGRATLKVLLDNPDIELVAVNDIGAIDNMAYLLAHDTVYGRYRDVHILNADGKQAHETARSDGGDNTTEVGVEASNADRSTRPSAGGSSDGAAGAGAASDSGPNDGAVGSGGAEDGPCLVVRGHRIRYLSCTDPAQLPWNHLGIDLVFECTGRFKKHEDAAKHIAAGATWVIISAPTSSENVPTVVHGVNHADGSSNVVSCASCTTNSITPVVEVLDRHFGVAKALLTTVHAYTATQGIVDSPVKSSDFRKGRAAAQNFVPASTGAAIATTKALPQMQGKFDGVAVRGPVAVGSISDLVFVLNQATDVDEVNGVLRAEADTDRYRNVLAVSDEQLVSSDIIGDAHACIVQLDMTRVVGGDLVKVMCWYDNEWGFTHQMVREARSVLGLSPHETP